MKKKQTPVANTELSEFEIALLKSQVMRLKETFPSLASFNEAEYEEHAYNAMMPLFMAMPRQTIEEQFMAAMMASQILERVLKAVIDQTSK